MCQDEFSYILIYVCDRQGEGNVTDKVKARSTSSDVTDETKARSSTSESNIKKYCCCVFYFQFHIEK